MKNIICFIILYLGYSLFSVAQVFGVMDVEGEARTFVYYDPVPEGADKRLILAMHGTTQTGSIMSELSRLHEIVDDETVVVYPDGLNNAWSVGLFFGNAPNDVAFLDMLIEKFIIEHGISENKIFACGFSAGGYLSYKMACESEHCIAAVASVAGVMTDSLVTNCQAPAPVPVMHIHGTADLVVNYNGSSISGASVEDVVQHWLSNNSCTPEAEVVEMPNLNILDLSTVTRSSYEGCSNNSRVVLYQVNNGSHTWPGTEVLLGGLGVINRDINASLEIKQFFDLFQCGSPLLIQKLPQVYSHHVILPSENALLNTASNALTITLYSLQGFVVWQGAIGAGAFLDFTFLPPSVYLVRSEAGQVLKWVKS